MIFDFLTAITSIVAETNPAPIFVYGSKAEVNALADQISIGTPVVFFVGAYAKEGEFAMSGGLKSSYSFLMQFMELTAFGQYAEDNRSVLLRQESCAETFLINLRNYKIGGVKAFDIAPNKDKYKIISAIDQYDANYTGVTLTMNNLKIVPNLSYC